MDEAAPPEELMRSQALLTAVDQAIQRLVQPGMEGSLAGSERIYYGYAGVSISVATRRLNLYWTGRVPPRVLEILNAAPRSITTEVLHASYSLIEMETAGRLLVERHARTQLIHGLVIRGVGPIPDGSGVLFSYWTDFPLEEEALLGVLKSIVDMQFVLRRRAMPVFL